MTGHRARAEALGASTPQLGLDDRGKTPIVVDHRSGRRIRHRLSRVEGQILQAAEQIVSGDVLARRVPKIAPSELQQAADDLVRAGLVFTDESLYLALPMRSAAGS